MADAVIQQDVDIQSPATPQNTSVAGSQAEATRMQSSTGVQQATGNVLTAESPDVKAEMAKNPGLTIDAAIGNVAMRQGKQDDAYLSQLKDLEAKQEMSKVDEIKKTTATPQTTAEIEAENPYAQELRQVNDQSVLEMQNYLNKLDEFGQNLSERSKAEIENIKKTFALRKDAQEKQNDAIMGLMQRAGAVSGRQRYAPEIQMQLISEEESVAISRLAALDVQEQQLILEAQKAADDDAFMLLQQRMSGILAIQKIKSETVTELYAMAKKEEEIAISKAREKREEAMFDVEYAGAQAQAVEQKKSAVFSEINTFLQSGLDFDTVDKTKLAEFSITLGIPTENVKNIFESIQKAQEAEAANNSAERDMEIVKILKDIPAGVQVPIGGYIYSGLKVETPNIATYNRKDSYGNETTVFYDKNTGETINEVQTGYASEATLLSGMTEDQRDEYLALAKEIRSDQEVKEFITVRDSYERLDSAYEDYMNSIEEGDPSAAASMAMVFNYMKTLDPGSVVREGEYANASNAAGVPERIINAYNKTLEGTVIGKDQAKDFYETGKGIYERKLSNYQETMKYYKEQAEFLGLPTEALMKNYEPKQYKSLDDFVQKNSDKLPQIEQMINDGLSDDDILEIITSSGFSRVGGDTKTASVQKKLSSAIPAGTKYTDPEDGECGYWSRKIVDYPSGTGNTLAEKKAFVKREGISKEQWLKEGARVGDVVITDESAKWGHVAVINEIRPDGTYILSESNFVSPYTVSHNRKLPVNRVVGVVRGKLKV